MEEQLQQQQQQQQRRRTIIHRSILNGIARLSDPQHQEARHMLIVNGYSSNAVLDRHSLQHLVHFLDNDDSHEVVITELQLFGVNLLQPSDGGLEILQSFFARSDDTTLTKVRLSGCNFGATEDASQLLMAFQTNTTVTDLSIRNIANLTGAALGKCLSGVMQSMPQLQRLDCAYSHFDWEDSVRSLLPGLRNNCTLKELSLYGCRLGNEGIRIAADALVGNRIMELLDISQNDITYVGLADITRLLVSTQIKTIHFGGNDGVFHDEDATQHFVTTLQHQKSSLQELPMIDDDDFPEDSSRVASYASIENSLARNQQLNCVHLLLAPVERL